MIKLTLYIAKEHFAVFAEKLNNATVFAVNLGHLVSTTVLYKEAIYIS